MPLESGCDPSGHVCVIGGGCCEHDGSEGFALQSTFGGGVPVVQLLTHVGPVPFPPDAATVVLVTLFM